MKLTKPTAITRCPIRGLRDGLWAEVCGQRFLRILGRVALRLGLVGANAAITGHL